MGGRTDAGSTGEDTGDTAVATTGMARTMGRWCSEGENVRLSNACAYRQAARHAAAAKTPLNPWDSILTPTRNTDTLG